MHFKLTNCTYSAKKLGPASAKITFPALFGFAHMPPAPS